MSLSVLVTMTPEVNSTVRPLPDVPPTVDLVVSLAVMLSVGFMGSPLNSM